MDEEVIKELLLNYARKCFPVGCKFFQEDGTLSTTGKLVVAALADKELREGKQQSPCKGCSFKDCGARDKTPITPVLVVDLNEKAHQETTKVIEDWGKETDEDKEAYIINSDNMEEPFVARVIQGLIEAFHLPYQFTKRGWLMISMVANGNPAKANFAFRRVIQDHPNKSLFTEKDVVKSFPNGIDQKEFETWWNGIKKDRGAGKGNEYSFYENLSPLKPGKC